jgi:hypothetical protein
MDIIQIAAAIVFVFLAGLTAATVTFFWQDRIVRARKNMFKLMALLVFFVVLGEIVWSPIKLLVIPIFFFGGWYIFYDAFIRRPESDIT